ncbi:jmjC domain, hydroxylase domain-containing protein [Trichoderma breve]|uniref:[histone H3]-trimethyl-L-lysine(9) demethylase n=1 Tax=Trichoderma breve TaxID=2034170 RepID=A0A9W9BD77_9HYPO|nr:jmjC domain, hydroxylase domain-containing protein [Trichoderma breve]KAJ4857686.1 jmjC domain, hydroxylase domain-containing protein [Trichoderma breve]
MSDDACVPEPSEALKEQVNDQIECAKQPAFLHSPPDSNDAGKSESSDSELSDLEDEPPLEDAPMLPPDLGAEDLDDIGDIQPDHWSSGNVPVFKPTMDQFKDFKRFMTKVDSYGMKSGIIKVIPPDEWRDAQPPLDDLVKQVRVREPIKQDIMGSNGTYRQVNILHGRSYNIPQWRQLCEQSEHQPPARRGERRANADKPRPTRARPAPKGANAATTTDAATTTSSQRTRGRGRPPKKGKQKKSEESRPMTPVSPKVEAEGEGEGEGAEDEVMDSIEKELGTEIQSTSARRKFSRREASAVIDEAAFKDFDYRMDISDYTPERCEELERVYWKTLTYAQPLYGADLMGTLFDERTENWNLNKLPNLLDVLGTKVPGVNTAYLYLGMWKATFAWHLEDVDLYSINYLHFGAPKQWYSISQADARRFETAMKSIWPADAKACDQFLRHKAFLISPQHLKQHYGIKVNKVVSYPGEFVVTYPYGYHSGYNLGYNCAEAVNFALDSWLEMGKIAKKCECAQAQDSVWVNVYEIERKLRGEETEYEETEEEDDDDDDDDDDELLGLPTPPGGHGVKFKDASRKRKRGRADKGAKVKVKKIRLRLKVKAEPPCCLCPNDVPNLEFLPTDDGRKAHRLCALYIPETYIDTVDGKEIISNVTAVHKDRLDLKCLFCRSKRGACFQSAGVFTEEQEVPVFGEDGTEYKEQAFEFSCRFHRTKRDKKLDGDALEEDSRILKAAEALQKGDICQMQYHKGEIFAGMVVENRPDERMLLVDLLPNGDRLEVEWKWLLLPDPSDYHLPKASANAIPLPSSQKAKDKLNAKRHQGDDKPRKGDPFIEGDYTWAEFHTSEVTTQQAKVDFSKQDQVWYYLGKTSTEARAQYTEDPSNPRHNAKGNFLDTLPKPPKPVPARPVYQQRAYGVPGQFAHTGVFAGHMMTPTNATGSERPYVYQPRTPIGYTHQPPGTYSFQGANAPPHPQTHPQTHSHHPPAHNQYQTTHRQYQPFHQYQPYPAQRFDHMAGANADPRVQAFPPPLPPQPQPQQQQQPQSSFPASLTARASATPANHRAAPTTHGQQQYGKPTWQVHSSVYQKYPFFQVNHNREPSKYRTPYSPWGGFTNGYEGDLRAHLLANQNDLLRRASLTAMSPVSTPGPYHASPSVPAPHNGPAVPVAQQTATSAQHTASTLPAPILGTASHQYHPAIKAQYRNLIQPPSKPKPTPVSKSYKVPSKQSPVPLPANFLAAMTPSAGTPAPSSAKHSPLQPGSPQGAYPSTKAAVASSPSPPQESTSPGSSTPKAVQPPQRISTTPVPLPKFSMSFQGTSSSPTKTAMHHQPEGFPDVPGCESMEFVERMMENLRKASQRRPSN